MHVLKCDKGNQVTRDTLLHEAGVLDQLRHPHVVNLYRVLALGWPSADSVGLDMEYCKLGDCRVVCLSTKEMQTCFMHILSALLYCHAQGARAIT